MKGKYSTLLLIILLANIITNGVMTIQSVKAYANEEHSELMYSSEGEAQGIAESHGETVLDHGDIGIGENPSTDIDNSQEDDIKDDEMNNIEEMDNDQPELKDPLSSEEEKSEEAFFDSELEESIEDEKKNERTDGRNISELMAANGIDTILTKGEVVGDAAENRALTVGSSFQIKYTFTLLKQLRKKMINGDYFDMSVPDTSVIGLQGSGTGEIIEEGTELSIGTYVFDQAEGSVRMTFNDNVIGEQELAGTLNLLMVVKEGSNQEAGVYQFDFPDVPSSNPSGKINLTTKKNDINIESLSHQEVGGYPETNWKLLVNPNKEQLSNAVIEQSIKVEQENVGNRTTQLDVKKAKLVKVTIDGTVIDQGDVELSFDERNVLTLPEGHDSYVLYTTGTLEFDTYGTVTSTVTMTGTNEQKDSDTDALSIKQRKLVSGQSLGYNNTTKKGSWAITYNAEKRYIPQKEAVINTQLSRNSSIDKTSIKVSPNVPYDIDYTDDRNWKLVFKEPVTEPVVINYDSNYLGGSEKNMFIFFDSGKDINNASSVSVPPTEYRGDSSLSKTGRYKNWNTVSWTISMNELNAIELPKGFEIRDTLNNGEIIDGSITVRIGKLTLKPNQYEQEYIYKEGKRIGFIITYKEPIKSKVEITYDSESEGPAKNAAIYTYKDQGLNPHEVKKSYTVGRHPEYIPLQNQMTGKYNAEHDEYEWEILINTHNKYIGTNSILENIIQSGQEYVPNSLELNEKTKLSDFRPVASYDTTKGKFDEENNKIIVQFRDYSINTYKVTFRTTLNELGTIPSDTYPVINEASYSDLFSNKEILSASVTNVNHHDFIKLEGHIVNLKTNEIEWVANVNPNYKTMQDVTFKSGDYNNLSMKKRSIQLREKDKSTNLWRKWTDGEDYTLLFTERGFYINFLKNIVTNEVEIKYRSTPIYPANSLGKDLELSNLVYIESSNMAFIEEAGVKGAVTVKVPNSSSNVEGVYSTLEVNKVNEENIALENAEFRLYRGKEATDENLVDIQTTDTEGMIEFNRLESGEYLLVERRAPKGYVVMEENKEGFPIVIPEGYSDNVVQQKVVNSSVENVRKDIPIKGSWLRVPSNQTKPDITVALYHESKLIDQTVLTEENKYEALFTDIRVYDDESKEIDYHIEVEKMDNVETAVSGNQKIGFSVINELSTKQIVTGSIEWDDNENKFNKRPEEVTVKLLLGKEEIESKTIKNQKNNHWTYAFSEVETYDSKGDVLQYIVSQDDVDQYKTEQQSDGRTMVNYYRNIEKQTLSVSILWDDLDDQFKQRPSDNLRIDLIQNGKKMNHLVLSHKHQQEKNRWLGEFKDVPVFDDTGEPYTYAIYQERIEPYDEPTIEAMTIKNHYRNKEKISVPVVKRWEDYHNKFKTRPETLLVELLRNNEVIGMKEMNQAEHGTEENSDVWESNFEDMLKYDVLGRLYEYQVREKEVPKEYVLEKDETRPNELVNRYKNKDKRVLSGDIIWNDYRNKFETRPLAVQLDLLKNGEVIQSQKVGPNSPITGQWRYQFEDVPVYDEEGHPIDYIIITRPFSTGREQDPNAYYTLKEAGNHFVYTYVNHQITSLEIEKKWEDKDDRWGHRPKDVTFQVMRDDDIFRTEKIKKEDTWKKEVSTLPRYNALGKEYTYKIYEEPVQGYQTEISSEGQERLITNWYKDESTMDLTGLVKWDDYNNRFQTRPETLTLILEVKNDLGIYEEVETKEYTTENTIHYEFKQLKTLNDDTLEFYEYAVRVESSKEGGIENYSKLPQGNDWTLRYINPATAEVEVTVTWDDYNNMFNQRPESVSYQLIRKDVVTQDELLIGELKTEATLDEQVKKISKDSNGVPLPRYNELGDAYEYRVLQEAFSEYESKIDVSQSVINDDKANMTHQVKVTNVYRNTDKQDIVVTKRWEDYKNKFNTRPNTITLSLMRDGVVYNESPYENGLLVTGDKHDQLWQGQFEGIKVINDITGEPYHYSVQELTVTGYDTPDIHQFDVINRYINKEKKLINGTLEWNDYDNKFGIRPQTDLLVSLMRNHQVVAEQRVASEADDFSFGLQDTYDANGDAYVYDVVMETPPYYTTKVDQTITGQQQDYLITQTYVNREEQSVTVKKYWDDYDDAFNTRPDSVHFNLLKNQTVVVDQVEVTSDTNWQQTIPSLLVYDEKGEDIDYSFEETDIPENYEVEMWRNKREFTNVYKNTDKVDIDIRGRWNDKENKLNTRPNRMTVSLYRNGELLDDSIELTKENDYHQLISGLLEFDDKGKPYQYTINTEELSHYKQNNEENNHIANDLTGPEFKQKTAFVLDYSYLNDDVIAISGDVYWKDHGNEWKVRPKEVNIDVHQKKHDGSTKKVKTVLVKKDRLDLTNSKEKWPYKVAELPKYDDDLEPYDYDISAVAGKDYKVTQVGYDVTQTYTYPQTDTISGDIKWDDYNNQFKTRPNKVQLQLISSDKVIEVKEIPVNAEEEKTVYSFEHVKVFDENGVKLSYQVEEVVTGELQQYHVTNNGFTIINRYENLEKTIVKGVKIWEDYENRFDTRPDTITLRLVQTGSKKETKELEVIEISERDDWHYEFSPQLRYDTNGQEYLYEIQEDKVMWYEDPIISSHQIINRYHNTSSIDVRGRILWKDYDNKFGTRPEKVTIGLYRNGVLVEEKEVQTLNEDASLFAFESQPQFDDDGQENSYNFKQMNQPAGYDVTYTDEVITNTYVNNETIDIIGTKRWNDYNNAFGTRPDGITLQLIRNDNTVATTITTADQLWKYEFKDVMKYDGDGNEFTYSVQEVMPEESVYESVIKGTDVINTYQNKELVDVTIVKVWDDHQNISGHRPTEIKISLMRNSEVYEIITLSGKQDTWEKRIESLPKYDEQGNYYVYTAEEESVPGYEQQRKERVREDGTIEKIIFTNKYENNETVAINGQMTWEDYDNQFSTRPSSVKVYLYRDGIAIDQQVEVNASNQWAYSFSHLKRINDATNEPYKYEVKEEDVKGYSTTNIGYDFYHVYTSPAKVEVQGVKVWTDYHNKFGTRPEAVTLHLLQNDEIIGSMQVMGANDEEQWLFAWTSDDAGNPLPRYQRDGSPFNYDIIEEIPNSYQHSKEWAWDTKAKENETLYHEITLNNNYVDDETRSVHVQKEWDDYNNKFKTRPMYIRVALYRNDVLYKDDTKIYPVTINGLERWGYEFKDLPLYDEEGDKYEYSVKEKDVLNYETEYHELNSLIVMNKYRNNETLSIPISMRWLEEENKEQRPEKVYIMVKRNNHDVVMKQYLSVEDGYETLIKDLPMYDEEGKEYQYSVEVDELTAPYVIKDRFIVAEPNRPLVIEATYNWTTIQGEVLWLNDEGQGVRPEEVQLRVYRQLKDLELEEFRQLTVSDLDNWQFMLSSLPKYNENLEPYDYLILEEEIPFYITRYENNNIINEFIGEPLESSEGENTTESTESSESESTIDSTESSESESTIDSTESSESESTIESTESSESESTTESIESSESEEQNNTLGATGKNNNNLPKTGVREDSYLILLGLFILSNWLYWLNKRNQSN